MESFSGAQSAPIADCVARASAVKGSGAHKGLPETLFGRLARNRGAGLGTFCCFGKGDVA